MYLFCANLGYRLDNCGVSVNNHHHHQPINVPTAGAQAFPMDYT
jgi:hypothetical protein